MDPELLWGVLGAGLLAAVHLGPSPEGFGLPCPFKLMAGIPCPACGMTRCWCALGRLEWGLAFRMHPGLAVLYALLWAYVPYALGAAAGLWPRLGLRIPGFRLLCLAAFGVLWGFLIWDRR